MAHFSCSVLNCSDTYYAKGWCRKHYVQFRSYDHKPHCSVEGCHKPLMAHGLCKRHYERWRTRGGDPAIDSRRRSREPIIEGDSALIPLTKGQFARVDLADLPRVADKPWYACQPSGHCWYAAHGSKGKRLLMHRVILEPPDGVETDHINRDGLDNRRCNLRICTSAQNKRNRRPGGNRNTSGYKGVSYDLRNKYKKYRACIVVDGKQRWLGYFSNAEDAAQAYDRAAREHFGAFASTNFR